MSNNQASFYLWWMENLLSHQNILKYYEHECLKNFVLLVMPLFSVLFVKSSYILTGICFAFLRNHPRRDLKGFQYQIRSSVKGSGKQLPCKTNFRLFLEISYSDFSRNSVKGFRVTKIFDQIKFEGVWGELEARNCSQRQSLTKYLRQDSSFPVEWSTNGKVQFLFFRRFLLVLAEFSFLAGGLSAGE